MKILHRERIRQGAEDLLEQIQRIQQADWKCFLIDFAFYLYILNIEDIDWRELLRQLEQKQVLHDILSHELELTEQEYQPGQTFQSLDQRCLDAIEDYLERLSSEAEYLYENTAEAFDYMLGIMIRREMIRDFITPYALADMMARMTAPVKGESVLDPVCGSGRMLVAAHTQCKACSLSGIDIHPLFTELTFLNLFFHGKAEAELLHRDCFSHVMKMEEKFDVILANPPYTDNSNLTVQFVERIIEMLRPGGRCAVLVPEGFLTITSGSQRVVEMRRKILESHTLEGVVALPKKIYRPYTESNSSLILLKKQRTYRESRVFMTRLPEQEKLEEKIFESVYQRDIDQIVNVWKCYHNEEAEKNFWDLPEELFWIASVEEIRENDYIFAADAYRNKKYRPAKICPEDLARQIWKDQKKLQELLYQYGMIDEDV